MATIFFKLDVRPDITLAEQLPEVVDVMEWESESDENGSECNVPEEYWQGKEQEYLNLSDESGSSSAESDEDVYHQNSLRTRSERLKHKTNDGIMTSSGRHVKKRNFDELDFFGSQDVTSLLHDLSDCSKRVSRAPDGSFGQEGKSSSIDQETGGSDALNDGSEDPSCYLPLNCQKDGVVGRETSLRNDCVRESNPQISDPLSIANDVPVSQKHKKKSNGGATLTQELSSCSQDQSSSSKSHEDAPIETKKPQQLKAKVFWLTLSTHEEDYGYIPQKGDEVAYLRQGHQEYLNFSSLREVAPWTLMKRGNIKAVEICKVRSLKYATLPGSGDSCCKMILKFIDPNSEVFNKTFKLTLPELVSFPDFLVERSRCEAAIQRNWTRRDSCKVWWRDEGEEDGHWWEGCILAVKPKSPDFPDSPWERYTVTYKSSPTETHFHSPWELFDADTKWEQPHIDEEKRNRLLLALTKLQTSDKRIQNSYGLQKLNQTMGNSSYTNRFPVPLSLALIRSRLENNYYRSVEALRHDVSVMLSNAETFFCLNKSVAVKISHLSIWFDRTLSSL